MPEPKKTLESICAWMPDTQRYEIVMGLVGKDMYEGVRPEDFRYVKLEDLASAVEVTMNHLTDRQRGAASPLLPILGAGR